MSFKSLELDIGERGPKIQTHRETNRERERHTERHREIGDLIVLWAPRNTEPRELLPCINPEKERGKEEREKIERERRMCSLHSENRKVGKPARTYSDFPLLNIYFWEYDFTFDFDVIHKRIAQCTSNQCYRGAK